MFNLFSKRQRDGHTVDLPFAPRYSLGGNQPRPMNNAKPIPVDTFPIVPDAATQNASFFYREGRDPAHQYSRVTTPLNVNPSFGGLFRRDGFVPGARLDTYATLVVPRTQNAGMRTQSVRVNQQRPTAGSYGQNSVNPVSVAEPSALAAKWLF